MFLFHILLLKKIICKCCCYCYLQYMYIFVFLQILLIFDMNHDIAADMVLMNE